MGFFDKIFSGLKKTRTNLEDLEEIFREFSPGNEDFYDDLEELLVVSDMGAETAEKIIHELKLYVRDRHLKTGEQARDMLIELLTDIMDAESNALCVTTTPSVILMVGVNGVGKTTTIGKLAHQLKEEGKKVLLCAGDTFRAAAAEQLSIWAERSGADIVKHEEGSDPGAVVYDAICAAKARESDVIIVDTAGRLHNKQNLMNELAKISRIIERELPEADVETLMVLDATTGQNGLIQAQEFLKTSGLTGIVLTKLDGTAKGGIVFAIANQLRLPVKYVGVGEGMDDLIPFNSATFVEALFKE